MGLNLLNPRLNNCQIAIYCCWLTSYPTVRKIGPWSKFPNPVFSPIINFPEHIFVKTWFRWKENDRRVGEVSHSASHFFLRLSNLLCHQEFNFHWMYHLLDFLLIIWSPNNDSLITDVANFFFENKNLVTDLKVSFWNFLVSRKVL